MTTTGYLVAHSQPVKLDNKDKKILTVLNNNARSSIAEISKKTGIQRDSTIYRINKLRKQKVIRYFHTQLNPSAMGYPINSFVNFKLHNVSAEKEKKFAMFVKKHSNIRYVAKTTGTWDFTISILAKDLAHFNKIITEIRRKFPTTIKEYDSAAVIEELKLDDMTGLIN